MGKDLPPGFEEGDDGIVCTATLFAGGPTPLYVGLTATDMVDCFGGHLPAPNGQRFILKQDIANPNLWFLDTGIWQVGWAINAGGRYSTLHIAGRCPVEGFLYTYFEWTGPPRCTMTANNTIFCTGWPSNHAEGGSAMVQWGPDIGESEYGAQ